MKIICIGRNYTDHAKEMKKPVPREPLFFLKPDSALLRQNRPFFYPEFSNEIHYELELVIRINKVGKYIASKYAHTYYNEIALGIDFTARDIQRECKAKGLPWEKAKAFDWSAAISRFVSLNSHERNSLNFHLMHNGNIVQQAQSSDMIFSFDELISYVSRYLTLKTGDLIYTGTPSGVGPVQIGDQLEGFLNNEKLLRCAIK
ncbi:MAG: fumarylacetoacetate hydrolase family protein [Bacteroidales bacterium]|nr:fumarylacetoacetate hydrolase family protein [Bacteroidales bacterium]